ncbi:hypothetical protein ANO11243_027590 [Dothideomycetidae sp. 11243]|nr:hypothetical protein ANO11243_027590 [fungal sp. No.11243]
MSNRDMSNNPAVPVAAYCASSILMTVTNKYVLSGHEGFNLNLFLLFVQGFVCLAAIHICKSGGIITYRDFRQDDAKKWFPVSLLLISMIYTASKAMAMLSIPVFTIFKNISIIFVAYGEVLWFGGKVTPMMLFSFGLIILSSVVAAQSDSSQVSSLPSAKAKADAANLQIGYAWTLVNCFFSAAFVLVMRKRIKVTGFRDYDTMFYNNLLSAPLLLIGSFILEDWSSANIARNFPPGHQAIILFIMVLSGLSAVFISYTSAWCVRTTSSTTYSMVGALNKIPIAVSGFVFFAEPVTFLKVCAMTIGASSGVVYGMARLRMTAAPAKDSLPTTESRK